MEQILEQIGALRQEIATAEVLDTTALEAFRIKYLGTKGLVKGMMGEMKNVPNEQKKEFGQILNDFKQFAEQRYDELLLQMGDKQQSAEEQIDFSLPGNPLPLGSRH